MKAWVASLAVLLAACGGGGGGGGGAASFEVVATVPADGTIGFATGTWISVTFSQSVDVSTLSLGTLVLLRSNGTQVPANIVTEPANPRSVRVQPSPDLPPDARFQLVVKSAIRSASGAALGADTDVCFITGGPTPAVREDQILDLGDRLNVPRYLAQVVRIGTRVFVLGGHRSATEATDTVEEWDPGTRTFKLLPNGLLGPRAEFTATLLQDGRLLIVGGVASPGGAPLATTEYFDPSSGSSPGPPLLEARRWHAASRFRSGVLVSGGFGDAGDPLDSLEYLENGSWHGHSGHLGQPSAQHLQFSRGFDDVYVTVGNLSQIAARVDTVNVVPFFEPDARFRSQGVVTHDGRVMVVAGDTRSIVIHDFDTDLSWLATKLLFDRRGAYSLTPWGSTGKLYLAAGGFQISAGGRTIPTLEIVEYVQNPGGSPNALVYDVTASELPFPMAGHVGFNDPSGATVLAGGLHDQDGDPTRSVVMILDDRTTPPATCK
ncbi:MAG TPA: Ig-like domain-containing protein [Planctomycetota bacterium]|nr:Ig-like domain-containing protein [Planctomycetota bacterium]